MEEHIPIYVINLVRMPERSLYMQQQLDSLGIAYQFIDAVDKRQLTSLAGRAQTAEALGIDQSVLENKYAAVMDYARVRYEAAEYERRKSYHLGALGCTLSHIKIYDLMVKNDIAAACILEDDTALLPTFLEVLRVSTKQSWDVLLFGHLELRLRSFFEVLNRYSYRCGFLRFDLLQSLLQDWFRDHKEVCEYAAKLYGFDDKRHLKQSEQIARRLRVYHNQYKGLIKRIIPKIIATLFTPKRHSQQFRMEEVYWLNVYASSLLGAVPEKASLNAISDDHCIAEPTALPFGAIAYLVRQSAAMKWKQEVLSKNHLAIDEVPWKLYKEGQVKLRLISPPCASATYNDLVNSSIRN